MWMHDGGGVADDQIQLTLVCMRVYVHMIKLVLYLALVEEAKPEADHCCTHLETALVLYRFTVVPAPGCQCQASFSAAVLGNLS